MTTPADNPPLLPPDAPAAAKPRKRRWWRIILITLGVLLLLAVLSVLGFVLMARSAIRNYTDTQPVKLPRVEVSGAEAAALRERLQSFFAALKGSQPLDPLVLSPADLNALLASPGAKQFKDRLYLTVDEQGIHGQFSVPLGEKVPAAVRGRYLNGQGDLRVSFQDGELRVWVENLSVHGKPAPQWLMKRFGGKNLAEGLLRNPEAYQTLQQLESITVTNSALVLTPKAP